MARTRKADEEVVEEVSTLNVEEPTTEEVEKIVENEPISVDEEAITEEVPVEDTIEVEAPEVIIENDESNEEEKSNKEELPKLKKLVCKNSFNDKYDNSITYNIGDVLDITDLARRSDLIYRHLAVEVEE